MATNTAVLLMVAATAALVLAGMLAIVVSKTRTGAHESKGATLADESAIQRRRELLADEAASRAHAAIAEIQGSLQHQTTSYRSEAVTTSDQLNEGRVHRLAG
jgi:hypothetical protein